MLFSELPVMFCFLTFRLLWSSLSSPCVCSVFVCTLSLTGPNDLGYVYCLHCSIMQLPCHDQQIVVVSFFFSCSSRGENVYCVFLFNCIELQFFLLPLFICQVVAIFGVLFINYHGYVRSIRFPLMLERGRKLWAESLRFHVTHQHPSTVFLSFLVLSLLAFSCHVFVIFLWNNEARHKEIGRVIKSEIVWARGERREAIMRSLSWLSQPNVASSIVWLMNEKSDSCTSTLSLR